VEHILPLAILAAALGALLAVAGTAGVGWVLRKKTAAANWDALHAEIDLCHEMAVSYLSAAIPLPLSRWPGTFYADALKVIIAEREIDPSEIKPIMAFFGAVHEVNLAFDETVKARDRHLHAPTAITAKLMDLELDRLKTKVAHLLGLEDDKNDVHRAAAAIVKRHRDRFNSLRWRVLFLRLRN
jgi:hypothetical protein